MATPEPKQTQDHERGASLALLPIAATLGYYALPEPLQAQTLVQFAPQLIAYVGLALWAALNNAPLAKLGLSRGLARRGLRIGLITGLALGFLNSLVILHLVPGLGFDITFLRQTPHAQLPVLVMVPWFIFVISWFVECNFRGFLLGRLLALGRRLPAPWDRAAIAGSLLVSALVFAFDPFMVSTFRQLHWIALWDGLLWALIWLTTGNLYATVFAHAVEVLVMYSAVRLTLMP